MKKNPYFRSLIILFVLLTALALVFSQKLAAKGVDMDVVLVANSLLFLITMANLYFLSRNLGNKNPNAVVRGMMAGTLIKLIVLAAAFLIYLSMVHEKRNAPAVYISMVLYLVYTFIEVRVSLRLNRKQ